MRLRDAIRAKNGEPALYRRTWKESHDPLVVEARAQTLEIQRLQIWLRLAYSVLALAALLGYWGFADGGGRIPGIVGIVVGVLAFACVAILRTGIAHGRANVGAMLDALEQRGKDTPSKL